MKQNAKEKGSRKPNQLKTLTLLYYGIDSHSVPCSTPLRTNPMKPQSLLPLSCLQSPYQVGQRPHCLRCLSHFSANSLSPEHIKRSQNTSQSASYSKLNAPHDAELILMSSKRRRWPFCCSNSLMPYEGCQAKDRN